MKKILLSFLLISMSSVPSFAQKPNCHDLLQLKTLAMKPTRIEKAGKLFVRRGDHFRLAPIHPDAAGDKLRQILLVLLDQLETIRSKHGGKVATYTGTHSPQGVFVATAARALGLEVLIGFAGKNLETSLQTHPLLQICSDLGCQMKVLSSSGFSTILMARLKDLFKKEGIDPLIVKCGMMDCDQGIEMLKPVERFLDRQVRTIPKDIETIVIPAGTGSSAGLIIRALKRNHALPKRIIVVQNAYYDRRPTIDKLIGEAVDYEYYSQAKYPYEKWIQKEITMDSGETVVLDGMVEAKAYEWMIENVDLTEEKTLFWIIAETVDLRKMR